MPAKKSIIIGAFGLGFLSTSTQVIMMRELLVDFTGNELTLATTLAVWLLSVGAGSFIFRRMSARPVPAGLLFIIAGMLAPLQVVLARCLDQAAGTIGEIASPAMVVALSIACVAPVAIALGGLFVGLVALASRSEDSRAVPIVYGYEAAGSAAAGVVVSILLLRQMNSFACMGVGGLGAVLCGAYLMYRHRRSGGGVALSATLHTAFAAPALAALAGVIVFSGHLDLATRRIQWSPLPVVTTIESRYGNLLVTRRDDTFDLFETGSLSYTIPDLLLAEEGAHIPMLYHPDPKHVLVIGGAGSGIVGEVAKHPSVRSVDYVELDPEIIRLTREYAPPGWLESRPGVKVLPIYGDGRKFVSSTNKVYDVVIIAVGVPVTLQTDRYYTVEFFRQVDRLLATDGLMAFEVPSGGAYIGPELGSLISTLRNTSARVFEDVILLPGDYIHFLASQRLDLEARTDSLPAVLGEREVRTSFVDEYHLFDRLAPLRRTDLDSAVTAYDTGGVNTDLKPVSASYAVERWAKHFRSGRFLAALVGHTSLGSYMLALLISAGLAVPLLMRAVGMPWKAMPSSLTLYALGLTSMFTQVLVIVGFQIVNGYVYGWIAALTASFMLGMGLASGAAGVRGLTGKPRHLPLLAVALAALPLAALGAMRLADPAASAGMPHLADSLFVGLAFAAGALGGLAFALASTLLARADKNVVAAGALAYGLDLCGAAVAGFTAALLAIPSLGVAGSAYAVALFNAFVLALVVFWRPRK
jgi:spermidine synthase